MLITSEHGKISKYVWLYGYFVSGIISSSTLYFFANFKISGIILAIWLCYVLLLAYKETTSNPKNIEILYSEKKTPPIVYFIWAMVQIVVMSFLGVLTFVLVLTVSGIIN